MSAVSIKTLSLAAAALAGSLMLAPQAQAMDASSQTFTIRARVPVSCWVRPDREIQAGEGITGNVVEACNNPGGYTVTANYRPLSQGERAQMIYDNRPIQLSRNGGQILRRSNIATIKTVNYRFQNVALEQPLTVFLTIQPI